MGTGVRMNDRLFPNIVKDMSGHYEFLGIHIWNYFEKLPTRGRPRGYKFDPRACGESDRRDFSAAVGEKRAAGTNRMLPADVARSARHRNRESFSDLETAIT